MNVLDNAKPENCFYCIDGSVLHNLEELEQKLRTASSHVFCYHANQSKNDFYNWVKDVFHDYELANELMQAKTPGEAAAAVRKHTRKAILARQEIENAITKAMKELKNAKTPKAAAAALSTKRTKKTKRKIKARKRKTATTKKKRVIKKPRHKGKARNKNRKLNKKRSKVKRNSHKGYRNSHKKRGERKASIKSRRRRSSRSRRGRKTTVGKVFKKQVKEWLKWLSINPKL